MHTEKIVKVAVSVGVLAVLAAVFVFLPGKNTVVFTKNGIVPAVLTIHAGETVTFKSERGKYFWPASDFHPTHTLFPAFDAKRAIAPDGSWSFTFDTPGVYPFHDHLAAYYTGIIRVEDTSGNVPDDCRARGGKLLCWQNQIFLALAKGGVNAAYDTFAELFQSDSEFILSCHSLAHNTGLASYQFYLKDPTFIYSPKALACGAGFYHGFMEGYLGATGNVKGAAAVCDTIGTALGSIGPEARLQCYHGIGHGAVETTIASSGSFGTEDAFIKDALALCEEASTGNLERYRCYSGVFNAVSNFYINKEYGLSYVTDDPLSVCARGGSDYKDACYGNMNGALLFKGDMNLRKAAQFVFDMKDASYRQSAFRYLLGNYALYHENDPSWKPVIDQCHAFTDEYDMTCIKGFAAGLVEFGDPANRKKEASSFCTETALSPAERSACADVVAKMP